MTLDYMADCALYLSDLELSRQCAEELGKLGQATLTQQAFAYLGLVALRENNIKKAVQYLLKMEKGFQCLDVTWRLATELYHRGEVSAVIKCIELYEKKLPKKVRKRWISQIDSGQVPDFEGYCC